MVVTSMNYGQTTLGSDPSSATYYIQLNLGQIT